MKYGFKNCEIYCQNGSGDFVGNALYFNTEVNINNVGINILHDFLQIHKSC